VEEFVKVTSIPSMLVLKMAVGTGASSQEVTNRPKLRTANAAIDKAIFFIIYVCLVYE